LNDLITEMVHIQYNEPKLGYDLTDLKRNVEQVIKQYDNYVILDENEVASAKKVIANLNKFAKQISDGRIAFATKYMEPLTTLENELKAITGQIKETSDKIKKQADAFVQKEKDEKKDAILAFSEWKQWMLFDEKWLNKTVSTDDILSDIDKQQKVHDANVLTIKTLTLSFGLESSKYIYMLEDIHTDIDDIVNRIKDDYELVSGTKPDSKTPVMPLNTDPEIFTRTYRVKGTGAQLTALWEYMQALEIKVERL